MWHPDRVTSLLVCWVPLRARHYRCLPDGGHNSNDSISYYPDAVPVQQVNCMHSLGTRHSALVTYRLQCATHTQLREKSPLRYFSADLHMSPIHCPQHSIELKELFAFFFIERNRFMVNVYLSTTW
jgi:hypothetical protein